ncbi:uncharacterized protein LOC110975798 [Acanthaster planci]|uniref:Uncharacterized protein LOC110975798 n=1 Tax=Acanthaster planci TaxID=133434 RepID=A0A8B7XTV0_ACAPL|nr:uncharacterized protein LOC110975798 [Acanthaster planci]
MNRLLIFAVLALTAVYQVSGVPRKPEEPSISAHCGMLLELRQVMLDNPGLDKRSPRNYWCGTTLNNRKSALCSCNHHSLLSDELIESKEANSFLKRGIEKRSLTEECCHEGCYYEEVYELC